MRSSYVAISMMLYVIGAAAAPTDEAMRRAAQVGEFVAETEAFQAFTNHLYEKCTQYAPEQARKFQDAIADWNSRNVPPGSDWKAATERFLESLGVASEDIPLLVKKVEVVAAQGLNAVGRVIYTSTINGFESAPPELRIAGCSSFLEQLTDGRQDMHAGSMTGIKFYDSYAVRRNP